METETKSVKKEMAFVSLADTLKVDWSSEHGPRAAARAGDLATLLRLRDATLARLAVPADKIPDQMLGIVNSGVVPNNRLSRAAVR